jgi:hypothetical protein
MRIIDLFALQVFAKNLDDRNFRVLQHNLGKSGLVVLAGAFSLLIQSGYRPAP